MDTHSNWKFKGYLKDEEVSCQACRANKPASYIVSLYSDDAEPVRFYLGIKEQVQKIQSENKEMIDYDDVYEALVESGYVNDVCCSFYYNSNSNLIINSSFERLRTYLSRQHVSIT
ncbi:hypothetical protein RMATCC62417_14865 [Rhizopus microsporus]|nr:hypothetical protein RMATCC62417_14865 [Rhizopus microsporus]